ncbi:MAG: acetoacetate--CoA ligase [Alphaproteobacteria bacterium]|jgi:acetoacetyl-CoA synthetase|nr:acetoacetate--CoA ligase [Alphaproteobacteria bacterium]MDP6238412.1 acetoacetate--CoA ligase [Alphaproteobacteria bacterium]MDP7173594.1 acetoacetate--CoA ligase [Alphaproteobacteria bacterium]|tara:strand:+ start:1733 stop:3688 length:1956 start_codon:yes stop_codon:yes gene_type:complete
MTLSNDPQPLWQPSPERIKSANLTAFMAALRRDWSVDVADYAALWDFSVGDRETFWRAIWDFSGVIGDGPGNVAIENMDAMPGARFFPDARLNFAENLLRRRGAGDAIVFWGENKVKRRLSWDELHAATSLLAQALAADGISKGDVVAGFIPNLPEAVIAMLATTSLGATWTSCSPDFGDQGVLDRFSQTEPKLLFCADGYHYNGKSHESLARVATFAAELPTIERIVVVPYLGKSVDIDAVSLADYIAPYKADDIAYTRVPFNTPLYVMYSSGTTDKPKCIVHGVGGTLLQHLNEHRLLCDITPNERVFYFTTCGWMMWNWLVSALASEATLLLYDGAPFYPDANILFDYLEAEQATVLGTSAKYIDALAKANLDPKSTHNLGALRSVLSTGSPLLPESFDYVYAHIKDDVCLSSMCGGTDILGCFMAGNPTGPVWRGEIQARVLGMAMDVFDSSGRPIRGKKGELVCTKPFPSMPICFWDDVDGARYRAAYFARYPGVWHHGDYVELTQHDGVIVYGRSDATLNPGGVRIGTSEIYRQVEQIEAVAESIVISQDWDGDVRVVLFVKLRDGLTLDDDMAAEIRARIREGCTPRHVPAKVLQVADIPRTKSGKIVELAVREVVHGRTIKNIEALDNPQALDLYRDRVDLRD